MRVVLDFGLKEIKKLAEFARPLIDRFSAGSAASGPLQGAVEALAEGLKSLEDRVEGALGPTAAIPPPPVQQEGGLKGKVKPPDDSDLPSSGEPLPAGKSVWDEVDGRVKARGGAAPGTAVQPIPGVFGRLGGASPYELALESLNRTHSGFPPEAVVRALREKHKDDPALRLNEVAPTP